MSPKQIEPLQCLIFFYTSCWSIPHSDAKKLEKYVDISFFLNFTLILIRYRVFGPGLVSKIERHITDKLNGEQCPGTSVLIETGSMPCKYIVVTSVVSSISVLFLLL